MATETIMTALQQDYALCNDALAGLSDWLGDESRVPLRHPLTACCSVILRHIDIEEQILFPRLLIRTPEHSELIAALQAENNAVRDHLHEIEDLVISNQRKPAQRSLASLRALMKSRSEKVRNELLEAIAECMTDPGEIGHLFHSGYFRGKYDPYAAIR
jgi:hemerythrin-like domain-containing protein